MVWSNGIPNPLIIGGAGTVGQIIVLDQNGNPLAVIDKNGIALSGTGSTMQMSLSGGFAQMIFSLLSDPTNHALISLSSDGHFDVFGRRIISNHTGNNVLPLLQFPPNGNNPIEIGTFNSTAGIFEGSFIQMNDTGMILKAQAQDDADTTVQIVGNGAHRLLVNLDNTASPVVALDMIEGDSGQAAIKVFNEPFHALPLTNSWVSATAPLQNAQYRFGNNNDVQVRGIITGGVSTNIAVLPTGYIPFKTISVPIVVSSGLVAGQTASLTIRGSSQIVVTPGTMSLSGVTVSGQQISLGNFGFSLDQ